jgi:2-methylaconitate cis-trans-isomerase PrpF
MTAGVLMVAAESEWREGLWHALRSAFYRTARRLFEGFVYC